MAVGKSIEQYGLLINNQICFYEAWNKPVDNPEFEILRIDSLVYPELALSLPPTGAHLLWSLSPLAYNRGVSANMLICRRSRAVKMNFLGVPMKKSLL